jgi:D-hexose-6-phosphate mutarotase
MFQEQLFVSKKSVFDGRKPIRGGIPVVFPQAGHHAHRIYTINSVADPGSGIGCLFDPWIRAPGWEKVSIRIRVPG